MRTDEKTEKLLSSHKELTTKAFLEEYAGIPDATVYSKIRALCKAGRLSRVGRGRYIPIHKPAYQPDITPFMREVNELLINECVGIDHCLYEKNKNLYVEAYKGDLPEISRCLEKHEYKVVDKKAADRFPAPIEGYVIVGPSVSEAPLIYDGGIVIPSLEKSLVDLLCQKPMDEVSAKHHFQRAMEIYPINHNRMKRYAARRGVTEELMRCVSSLDTSRIELFSKVQDCLSAIPVTKAWVFGSFARGEEKPESDLDLLVDFDKEAHISLLDIIRFKLNIEQAINREVDLVTNGTLKPFAVPSADRDKYLIYER